MNRTDFNRWRKRIKAADEGLFKHARGKRIDIWSGRKYLPDVGKRAPAVDDRTGRPITLPKFSWDRNE